MKHFKEYPLSPSIQKALSKLEYITMLEVQEKSIPLILEDKDLIVQSQTGSGKTAAFAIPICEKIDLTLEHSQAIVLTPTRELALQVKDEIQSIGMYKGVTVCALIGKEPMMEQRKALKKNPHVIVATPGRLMDHITNKNIKLNAIRYFVIDEADEMLLMGFKEQIEFVIKKIPENRVTLLFSATMPDEVKILAQMYMRSPQSFEIEAQVLNIDKIEQIYYAVDGLKKLDFMKKMMRHEQPRKAIVFCNTQEQVDQVYEIMKKWDRATTAVHGGMEQHVRTSRLNGFKKGEFRVLIATDLAARGLHVRGITHVINYGVPFDHENYIHRIGRTGRVDAKGIAITMVIPSEMSRFKELETFLGYEIPCKGGHVERKPKRKILESSGKQRFKEDNRVKVGKTLELTIGLKNHPLLKRSDILSVFRNIPELKTSDIGKVEILEKTTRITILNDKEKVVLRGIQNKTIKGIKFRGKIK